MDCRLIAVINDTIVRWAALSNVSSRCVYSGVAEVGIYVDSEFRGKGVGDKLMNSLIKESELNGIWSLQAGIFPENIGSIKLHHKHGFRTIGIKELIGKMNKIWRDVAILERRSKTLGIDKKRQKTPAGSSPLIRNCGLSGKSSALVALIFSLPFILMKLLKANSMIILNL